MRTAARRVPGLCLLAVMLALAAPLGCGASLRAQAVAVSNRAVDVVDAGTAALLARYCAASMAAVGRAGAVVADAGRPTGVRCEARGPRAGTPRTAPEEAALAAVREAWRVPLERAEAVVQAQRVAALLRAGARAADGEIVAALGGLAGAYEALRGAAAAAGVYVPPPLALAPSP